MEEIITLDGKQFKLTTDRPLTALERQQTIDQIRKQTGCSSCGTKTVGQNWNYGGVYGLPVGAVSGAAAVTSGTCAGPKGSGSSATLQAAPIGGVAPYTVTFYKQIGPTVTLLNTVGSAAEAVNATSPTATFTYTPVTDADMAGAIGGAAQSIAVSNISGAYADLPSVTAGYMRFFTITTDACPNGPGWCTEYCDVSVACAAPTCNFTVS